MINDPLLDLLKSSTRDTPSGQLITQARVLLDQGADPNACDRTPQKFACALGLACALVQPQLVELLVQRGAKLIWPQEKPIEAHSLAGDKISAYIGPPVNPFHVVCERLGQQLGCFHSLQNEGIAWNDTYLPGLMEEFDFFLAQSCEQQIDLVSTGDPALGNQALDQLLFSYINTTSVQEQGHMPESIVNALAHCLVKGFEIKDPSVFWQLTGGDFSNLPLCNWEWYEDMPQLAEKVQLMAREKVMENLPSVPARHGSPRL